MKCSKCGAEKESNKFSKKNTIKGTYNRKCKQCCYEELKIWRTVNREKALEILRRSNQKRLATAKGKLNRNMTRGMLHSIKKGSKDKRHWETLVDFTIDQLKAHLEKLFQPGMTRENYGTAWHIDHKIPVAVFNFERPNDIDFRLCWSLKNLQPMEKKLNLSKNDKLEKPFQPALAIGGN